MSCAPPSGWTVAEWIVDASPLVMGLEFRDFFDRDHCFSLFLYEIPGGRSFPPWPSFFFAEYFFRTLGKLRIKKTLETVNHFLNYRNNSPTTIHYHTHLYIIFHYYFESNLHVLKSPRFARSALGLRCHVRHPPVGPLQSGQLTLARK
jgi:hypothetical protein